MISRSSRDKRKRKMSTWGILGCGTIANEMAETFIKMGLEKSRKICRDLWSKTCL